MKCGWTRRTEGGGVTRYGGVRVEAERSERFYYEFFCREGEVHRGHGDMERLGDMGGGEEMLLTRYGGGDLSKKNGLWE